VLRVVFFVRQSISSLKLLAWSSILLAACSPVSESASTPATNNKAGADQSTKLQMTSPSYVEQSLTLPTWCSMNQSQDQLCFRCERLDSGVTIPYEQCLTPSESFNSSRDCSFVNDGVKYIHCDGTKSGEAFKMDVSIAKEKVALALPAFLIALDWSVKQKQSPESDMAKFTADLSDFWANRIGSIMSGENLEPTADDLVLLAKKHLKSTLSDEQAKHFRQQTVNALTILYKELSGSKDYKLSQVILRGISIANAIPDNLLGDAKPFLSGPSLAAILSEDSSRSIVGMFSNISPSILGIRSVDALIQELNTP